MLERKSIFLIHPPVAKPCEPPAGIARLAWALRAAGIDCRVWDASLEGLLDLVGQPVAVDDTWSRRATKNRDAHIAALRSPDLYRSRDRYRRAVMDVNRLVSLAALESGARLSIADFSHPDLAPVRSRDLVRAAETFETSPFYPHFSRHLRQLTGDYAPDIVGLSINFMSQALCAFAMIGFIRGVLPAVKIVVGGGLVTSWAGIPGFGNPFGGLVDELIAGPGEDALVRMCGGTPTADDACPGYDFAELDWDRYLAPVGVLPYNTSKGCYWKKCAFCPEKAENGPYRPVLPKDVSAGLTVLGSRRTPGLVHFLDNALAPRLMKHLIANPPGIPWYGFARITPHLADPDFATGLRASGCVMLKLGVESGDQAVLDALSKGVDLATVSAALQNLKAAGIATYVYLLFGTPAETEDRARRTLDFTLDHADAIDFLNLAIFNLPAYSVEAQSLETLPFYDGDLSLYREFVHPAGWNRDAVRRFLGREFKRPEPIRRILNNDPPFFTSNHAPFFGTGMVS
ncbi:MAG: B12-binding domain-containing radical SAM protein [Desulfobacterales bacterium]|nr:B12-binding domain-containing radical SAM protein [Desulfobacterales bacterium]